jgi:hypothetical protein
MPNYGFKRGKINIPIKISISNKSTLIVRFYLIRCEYVGTKSEPFGGRFKTFSR